MIDGFYGAAPVLSNPRDENPRDENPREENPAAYVTEPRLVRGPHAGQFRALRYGEGRGRAEPSNGPYEHEPRRKIGPGRGQFRESNPMHPESGYSECACRDCMGIAISDVIDEPELCQECAAAGCEKHHGECQAPGAYGGDREENPAAYVNEPRRKIGPHKGSFRPLHRGEGRERARPSNGPFEHEPRRLIGEGRGQFRASNPLEGLRDENPRGENPREENPHDDTVFTGYDEQGVPHYRYVPRG